MRKIIIIILSLWSSIIIVNGQNKMNFKEKLEFLIKDGGNWRAENPNFDSEIELSPIAFGYTFEKGFGENSLKLHITGFMADKEYVNWVGIYFWHPLKNRTIYYSLGAGGQVASGETINSDLDLVFEIVYPDGSVTMHKDTDTIIEENEFQSKSYKLQEGTWVHNRTLIWKRVKE